MHDISEETERRIINFMNKADSPADIAGVEPADGPIFDDPTTGYDDERAGYDIGETVAQRIIDERDRIGGFTSVSEIADVDGLGPDKLDDIIYSLGPAMWGEWNELPYQSPVSVVHGAVLKSGKVLLFAGGAEEGLSLTSVTFDPDGPSFDMQTFGDDLFCSHHSVLADGTVLVNGGAKPHDHGDGITATWEFDPDTESWSKTGSMEHPRWYPTTLTLPAGDGAITFSGRVTGGTVVDEAETYDDDTETWSPEPPSANRTMDIYPGMHLLPSGEILYTGTRWSGSNFLWSSPPNTALYDLETDTWSDVGPHVVEDRTEGMSVSLPPDNKRVLVIGGRGDDVTKEATKSVEMIDFDDASPSWQAVSDMNYRRRNLNAVLLPTGEVLVCGGVREYKFDHDPNPVMPAEIYDPDADTWTEVASMNVSRQYHSIAVLLPDARVLTAGSIPSDHGGGHVHGDLKQSLEVYEPPYLHRGDRPALTSVPETVHHGDEFDVDTPDADDIDEVVLVRPGAPTHHTDSEQRVVSVSFSRTDSSTLSADAPNGDHPHYDAIRGQYMLFVIDDTGVPSEGEFLMLH